MPKAKQGVQNPTYMADIRHFFDPVDIEHMAAKNIDLGSYAGVKKNALAIYAHTTQPGGDMPPDTARKWTAARSQTFRNWILAGYPIGSATVPADTAFAATMPATRVRKNVVALSQGELDKLKAAFEEIMRRDAADPTSYSALASIHGLPQSYCLHHEDRYNPWHRAYLKIFEDALRSVPGCEDVTLPFWDISMPIPNVLKETPFDDYVIVQNLGPDYGPNYRTQRYDQADIDARLAKYNFFQHMDLALRETLWGVYGVSGLQDQFIAAHDGGHLAIGPTMADQNIASYDPIFWFYHCNLDRLWLRWQINDKATTLAGFKTTLADNIGWLSAPFNELPPFPTTADQTIDVDISYEEAMVSAELTFVNRVGSLDAARRFTISSAAKVSIMIKNINRLNIPGSFVVSLLADGKPVESRAVFQPKKPQNCATCRKLGVISVNFQVDADKVVGRKLSIEIEVPAHEGIGTRFPLSGVGDPTINARLLLEEA